jgi:hypothetical protein
MSSKAVSERVHFRRRCAQRYGHHFGRDTMRRFVQAIRENRGRAVFLLRCSCARTIWAVRHDDMWIPVVYNRHTKQVITALPPSALRGFESRLAINEEDHGNSCMHTLQ